MEKELTLYHGSKSIIEKPLFGFGKKNNDYGLGFYCTEDEELAKEWAVSSLDDGFANKYTLNTEYLNILDLNSPEYSILNWLTILLENRVFSIKYPIAKKAKNYLINNFNINVNSFDVIKGYRADDSYFDYAEAFLNNTITVEQLAKAMKLGDLGEQIVIKSKYAFANLKFEGFSFANKDTYYIQRKMRNDEANFKYFKMLEKTDKGLFITDIINKGVKNNDSRIPRNVR